MNPPNIILISTENAAMARAICANPNFHSAELFPAKSSGHKFKVGDVLTLIGLRDFPEHNGETVKITAIREDGSHGKAYYVQGNINKCVNWIYEYRLTAEKE